VVAEVQQSWKNDPAQRFGDTWPQGNHITWVFPGNGARREISQPSGLTGSFIPRKKSRRSSPLQGFPSTRRRARCLSGRRGRCCWPHKSGPILLPREKFAGHPETVPRAAESLPPFLGRLPRRRGPRGAVRATGPMTEAILLGTVAVRMPGIQLQWDAAGMNILNRAGGEPVPAQDVPNRLADCGTIRERPCQKGAGYWPAATGLSTT